jgi:AcrR family transcriptional regulator
MPRTKQRTPALRDHVLSVAVELLPEVGVSGFTARRIAHEAQTSTPAVYELFGDKSGLLREVYFEGFRLLRQRLGAQADTDDPRADLVQLAALYRAFVVENPVLSQVMFSRPFTDFDPGPSEVAASSSVRIFIVEHVRRCIDGGLIWDNETDVAHVFVSLIQGLAASENAHRLGTTKQSIDRRWALALSAVLDGLSNERPGTREYA